MEISLFTKCLFEFIGTLVLVLLGDGVVASTVLKRSKGFDGGWIVITIAWGLAVMCGVLIAGPYSGAHLNPAVSVGLAVAGSFPWAYVPGYVAAQLLGGFCGAVVVYLYYKDHFDATDDPAAKLGVFCTMPAIMDKPRNLFCEVVGTFLLVFVILAIGNEQNTPEIGMGSLGSLPVTMLIRATRSTPRATCRRGWRTPSCRSGAKEAADGITAGFPWRDRCWAPWRPD